MKFTPLPWLRKKIISFKLDSIQTQLAVYKKQIADSGPEMQAYDKKLALKRKELVDRVAPLYKAASPDVLSLFLIQFSAIGTQMTSGVPGWFRRIGQACVDKGFEKIGKEILEHSQEEDDHSLWFEKDLQLMVDWQKRKKHRYFNAERILKDSRASCVQKYSDLHENLIRSPMPLAWLALKYEIELLSLELGPQFISQCVSELGFGILKGLSFVSQHAVADVTHIRDDLEQLTHVLDAHPQSLQDLVAAGEHAIEIYALYFEEAFRRAKAMR
jgi:hypothetical protein